MERTCKGPCGQTLPETNEFFYFRKSSKNGKLYASSYCLICEKQKAASSRKAKYATPDGKAIINHQNYEYRQRNPEINILHGAELKQKYAEDSNFREHRLEVARQWRLLNPEKKKAANRNWHQSTKHRTNKKRALFATFYPDLKLRGILRAAICEALKFSGGSKNGRSILKHLPYTMEELRTHLESLWEPWMTWENYGVLDLEVRTWQIDHITPQTLLPFSDFSDSNFFQCWALSNLRPLESSKNLEKGCRIISAKT